MRAVSSCTPGRRSRKGRYDEAMDQTRDLLLPILDALPDDAPPVLLEPTAGQGQSLCSTLDELDEYLHRLEHHPRLGICVDTCHFFAAGHDLAADGGMNDFLDHLEKVRGGVPVGLIHANDSMDVVGAKKDRHAAIGSGHIGAEPFRALLAHPTMQQVPLVVETPGDEAEHAADVSPAQVTALGSCRMSRSAYYWFTDGASPVGSRRTSLTPPPHEPGPGDPGAFFMPSQRPRQRRGASDGRGDEHRRHQ